MRRARPRRRGARGAEVVGGRGDGVVMRDRRHRAGESRFDEGCTGYVNVGRQEAVERDRPRRTSAVCNGQFQLVMSTTRNCAKSTLSLPPTHSCLPTLTIQALHLLILAIYPLTKPLLASDHQAGPSARSPRAPIKGITSRASRAIHISSEIGRASCRERVS